MRTISFNGFVFDPKRRVLSCHGTPVKLQAKAVDILALLLEARDRPVTREEIFAGVWRGQAVVESNLTVQMSNLRRALAEHGGGDLIITLASRGYQFVGDVVTRETAESEVPMPVGQGQAPGGIDGDRDDAVKILPLPWPEQAAAGNGRGAAPSPRDFGPAPVSRLIGAVTSRIGLSVFAGAGLAAAFTWGFLASSGAPSARAMVAHVRVETSPDEVYMQSGSLRYVDYKFAVLDPVDVQLESEDWQFMLTSGKPIGPGIVGGRIYRGSFPIRGGTTGIYHNNIYLVPQIVQIARSTGNNIVQLRHVFHLRDPQGNELRVPAVLMIHLDPWAPLK